MLPLSVGHDGFKPLKTERKIRVRNSSIFISLKHGFRVETRE